MFATFDRAVAGGIIGIGLLHILVTPLVYQQWALPAMWFLSAGLALAYAGALNLLRERYAIVAPGLRYVCLAANLAMAGFCAGMVAVMGARALRSPQIVLLFTLVVCATVFSCKRPPRLGSIQDEIKSQPSRAA